MKSIESRGPDVAGSNGIDITQLRQGMEVCAADGVKLGTIAEVWVGMDPADRSTPCDEEVCSRVEVHAAQRRGGPLYIPYSALAAVSGHCVTLNVDTATAHTRTWHHRPSWLPVQDPGGIQVVTIHAGLAQFQAAAIRPGKRK